MRIDNGKFRATAFVLSAGFAMLIATGAVKAEDKVVIATYGGMNGQLFKQAVADPFQKQTGVPVQIFESPAPATSVASAGGSPQFQLAIVGAVSIPDLVTTGKIEEITPEQVPNIKNIPQKYWLKTPDGKLAGIPVYSGIYGIAYNTDMAKASDFSSWTSLADPKWKGLISVTRATFAAVYDLTIDSRLAGGNDSSIEPGIPLFKKVLANASGVYSSMATVLAQLGRGEVAAAPFYSTEIAQLKKSGVKNVDFTIPKEGGLLLPYFLVIPKGATNLPATYRLLNEVLTPSYQQAFAIGEVWPVNPAAKLSPAQEKEMGASLDDALNKNLSANWWVIGSQRAARTRQVDDLISAVR